jgi:hypothetical protein
MPEEFKRLISLLGACQVRLGVNAVNSGFLPYKMHVPWFIQGNKEADFGEYETVIDASKLPSRMRRPAQI